GLLGTSEDLGVAARCACECGAWHWYSAPFNLFRIPLAWALAFPLGFGAAGIWWAINLTTYAKAILKGWAAWRGRWAELVL
ncbi:MAG TPA: hypothetical protein VHH93_01540, partial [Gammaproteobacteria bacterium]|nr:hypothetical protein [Gammaproteobacteria bacterium]